MKMHLPLKTIPVFALSTALFASGIMSSSAQKLPNERMEIELPPGISLKALNETAAQITKLRPDIPSTVLNADAQIIRDTFPQISAEFAKVGLTEEEARWASQTAWKTARVKSPLRLSPEKTIDQNSFFEYVTRDLSVSIIKWRIQNENPEINRMVLNKDVQLIAQAQSEIETSYKRSGWSALDAHNASLVAWQTARLESPLRPYETIDLTSFIEAAGGMGIMVFTSEPDQAEVFIGTNKIGTTNKQKNEPVRYFPDGRKVTVRFIKPDFVPQDLECLAQGQNTVICKAELKHK